MDDATLLRRYADDRSEEAFAELVRRHLDLVYSTALRQLHGHTHRAEDVAQGVFTDLAKKARRLSHRQTLAGWLYLSAHHGAAALMRTEQRRQIREQEASIMNEQSEVFAGGPAQLRAMLDQALQDLGERDREVVLLRFFEQLPFAEVGAALSLNEDAARKRAERALERLRGIFARRGVTSTASALALVLGDAALAAPAGMAGAITSTALTAAAGASGALPGTALLHIMTTTKAVATIGALAVIVATGAALHQLQVSRQLAGQVASAAAQYSAGRGRVAELQRRLKAIDQVQGTARPAGMNGPGAGAAVAAAPSAPGAARRPVPATLQKAMTDEARAGVAKQYGSFLVGLGFSPAQIEQFVDAIAVPFTLTTTDGSGTRIEDSHPDPAAMDAALRDLLGPANYQQFKDFQANQLFQQLAAQVATQALGAGSALTPAQVNQLAQVFGHNSQGVRNRMGTPVPSINWAQAVPEAAGILAPEQMAVVDSIRLQTTYQIAQKAALYPDLERLPGP